MTTVSFGADGTSVIKESEHRIKSSTEKTVYKMDLIDAEGKTTQSRDIELYYKKQGGVESTLFKFTAPPVVQGTGLLIVDEAKPVNDIWMYLPATRRIRRIAGAEKSNWFMGTEFTHEDFEDYKSNAYSFQLDKEGEACGAEQQCFVITATASAAAEKDASGYSRKVYWIERETMYPVRIDYYDKAGAQAKRLDVRKLVKVGNYWRPQVYEMRNLANGRMTRLTALSREVDSSLDDHFVSQRYLRAE
ncbi:outer membrane lipoprotein-sorting protein [Azohydromonas aeria]|uniref:outer membrane lipoprotein-sorting protein n=1 Tax=Azohydromonas aeria TaxID=2590212 RepID=UPI0012F7351E|nr:outer membrane lipoprotein-sorting protein [Azohydromonas aeria]